MKTPDLPQTAPALSQSAEAIAKAAHTMVETAETEEEIVGGPENEAAKGTGEQVREAAVPVSAPVGPMDAADDLAFMAKQAQTIDGLPASFRPVRFIPPARVATFDTETTGYEPFKGDRLISIGLVILDGAKIVDRQEWFCNPERPIPPETTQVHGITDAMVADKPRFREIADDIVRKIGDLPLVIHRSGFDMGFIQAELRRAGMKVLTNDIIDTLEYARISQAPGSPSSLDALMKQIGVSWINREHHGALKDAEALAYVYLAYCAEALRMKPRFPLLPAIRTPRPVRRDLYQISAGFELAGAAPGA